jgi:hypothetical protein
VLAARRCVRGVLFVATLAVLGACESSSPESDGAAAPSQSSVSATPLESPSPSPSASLSSIPPEEPEEVDVLVFLRGRVVRSFDLSGGEQEPLLTLPTGDAVISPDGATVAVVAPSIPTGNDEEFLEYPELLMVDMGGGARSTVGPGFSPQWSAAGHLAYLEPVERRACDGEQCSGRVRVTIIQPGGAPRRSTRPGHWNLLGWAGDRVLVADRSDLSRTLSLGPDGTETVLAIPPSQIWGGSPDGRWLIQAKGRTTRIRPLDADGAPAGRGPRVELSGAALGPGAWAPDSASVAGVAIRAPSGGIPISSAVTFSTDEPEPSLVPGSRRASGNVIWASDSSRFAYVQATGPRGGHLTARMCAPGGSCRDLFHWTQGVTLLALR